MTQVIKDVVAEHKKVNQDLVEVYKDTLLEGTKYPFGISHKYKTKDIDHLEDRENQTIFNRIIERNKERDNYGWVEVIGTDTVSALQELKKTSSSTCVLNMASATRPGGGVAWGAKAQEEALFRCSNLGLSISVDEYPLDNDEAIYTYDAVFFKDFHYNTIIPIYSDVITIAAVNKNNKPDMDNSYYELITEEKIRMMINLAYRGERENLVLGAWGCGVFNNDPTYMASLFKKILIDEKFRMLFKNVIFAVINDHNSVGNNYEIFKRIIKL